MVSTWQTHSSAPSADEVLQTFYFAAGIDIFRTLVIKVKSTRTNIYKFGTKDI